jgi:hypothetical protein
MARRVLEHPPGRNKTHASLKVKATADAKAIERTPAMAAGITDHIWTVEELLETR